MASSLPSPRLSSLEKKSLLRDNVDLLVSLADVYFRAGDTKNAILKFEQAQMLDPYLIKGVLQDERSVYLLIEQASLCVIGLIDAIRLKHQLCCLQEWMFMDT